MWRHTLHQLGTIRTFILQPWQFFVVILVGWVQREQQKIILFYQAELEAVMKAQGKKRLLLPDDQRRLLVSPSTEFCAPSRFR